MDKNIIERFSNLEAFKSGAKLNIFILAGLGLIHSFWTQGVLLRVCYYSPYDRYADYLFILTILKTYITAYLTTAAGLVWGLHNNELRFVKLWRYVKYVEVVFNIITLLLAMDGYRMGGYIPIIVVIIVLGVYVIMSVKNLYKNLLERNDTNNEEKVDLSLPKYDISSEVPSVHKPTTIN